MVDLEALSDANASLIYRAVLLIEDETGKQQAYEIGDAPNIPFSFIREGDGRIAVSGLFLGGAVWDAPTPEEIKASLQAADTEGEESDE